MTLPLTLVAGPGVAPGSTRLMRPHGYLTDRPAIGVPRLQTPQRRRRTSGLARSFLAESRGPEPHTLRCHRCSKPCRRACPVDSPRWRTAEALIPSAEAPTRLPIEAGGAPVHCPNGGVTAGLHRSALRRPSAFKAAPARLSGSSSPNKFGHHGRTRTCILDLRRVVLIRLSYVVMVRRQLAIRRRRRYVSSSTSQ